MQVVCSSCQLSFDAPDGATGLVCPICRGPLRPQAGDANAAAVKTVQDWSGGDLDDLIAILSAPASSARVEVLPPNSDVPAGEVHLLAGGVSDALFAGQATDDALDRLRAIKGARFRVEPRLPNPANGDLSNPGAESGTLESRALAHLMRYCEDYVITCSIEVWRGNENARVEYRRGEISRRDRRRHRCAGTARRGDEVGVRQLPPGGAAVAPSRCGAEACPGTALVSPPPCRRPPRRRRRRAT